MLPQKQHPDDRLLLGVYWPVDGMFALVLDAPALTLALIYVHIAVLHLRQTTHLDMTCGAGKVINVVTSQRHNIGKH